MATKNATLEQDKLLGEELEAGFDLDELEEKLQAQLETEIADWQELKEEREKIGNPEELGEVIGNVVWEQFLNQVAVTAGEDFIKENRGLTLDLRNEAHIQTTENFAEGKIASHNTEIDYQQRYDDWQANFQHDENGNVVTHQTRSGKEEATLVKGAREPFDKGRPKGSAENHTDMDHTVSAAEIIRDAAANAHMTKEEQIAFANSDANLNEMDSSLNRSKGDNSMTDWLDNPNSNGQKPDEIFDISAEDEAAMRQKDKEAREEYERQKKEGEKGSIEAGKKSQRQEAFRIGKTAIRAVVMQLLAELVRDIISKLVKWLKSAKKTADTLLESLKDAIHSFIGNMKKNLISAEDTLFTTVAVAINPAFKMIKKVFMMLKQGGKSILDAVKYIKNPANKGKSTDVLLMEAGKIVMAGLTGIGAIALGETIEKGLMTIPLFAVQIPLLGSLANILGIFFGAVVAGIIGAIVINIIDKQIAHKLEADNIDAQIGKGNVILNLQQQVYDISAERTERSKVSMTESVRNSHQSAAEVIKGAVDKMRKNGELSEDVEAQLNLIESKLSSLEE